MRNTPPPTRRVRTAHESKSAAVRAAAAAPSRRQQSKWQREQHQQHRLYIAIRVMAVVGAGGSFWRPGLRSFSDPGVAADSPPTAAPAGGPTPAAAAAPPAPTTPTAVPTLDASGYGPALQQLLDKNSLSEADFRDRLMQSMLREKLQTAIGIEQVPDTQEQVHARHILVATQEQADAILAQLQAGADLATLASQQSTDPGSTDKR